MCRERESYASGDPPSGGCGARWKDDRNTFTSGSFDATIRLSLGSRYGISAISNYNKDLNEKRDEARITEKQKGINAISTYNKDLHISK